MDPCRQFVRTSMQNLESVDQKMAVLPLDVHEPPPLLMPLTIFSHNLLGQFIRTSMQNLESVTQKWPSYGHFPPQI